MSQFESAQQAEGSVGHHSTLEDAMATIADPLDAIVEVGDGVIASAVPLADSRAMADIADAQARFHTATLTTPIENALTYASMSCRAAMDAAKALAHLLRHPDLFVWAPMITARAGLDAAGRAYWLLEPSIGVERRVQRCLTLRLHSGREMKRAPTELVEARQNGDAVVADVKAQASTLGWTLSGRDKTARVGSEELPTSAKSISAVLAVSGPAGLSEHAGLFWWQYSGLMHAVPWALIASVETSMMRDIPMPGMAEAPLMISGPQLARAAESLGRAVGNVLVTWCAYLGADETAVVAAGDRFVEVMHGVNRGLLAGLAAESESEGGEAAR